MPISVTCEECNKTYRVKDELAGKRIKCKECGAPISIPDPEAEEFVNDSDDELMEAPRRQKSKGGKTSAAGKRTGGANTLDDIFRSDRSIWLKMLGGAIVGPVLVVWTLAKQRRRGGPAIDFTSPANIGFLIGGVVMGAVAGVLLSAKDVVQRRLADGQPVAFPWVLLFGKGMVSLGCVWFPLVIFVTFVITMLTLGI